MAAIMAPVHRWTRQKYQDMVLRDIFQPGERVELIDGMIVEVADTTLGLDRNTKRALYARNGIPEYWLVNLRDNCLEVYRDLREGQYRFEAVLRHGDTVRPQAWPDHAIAVADLLP